MVQSWKEEKIEIHEQKCSLMVGIISGIKYAHA